MNRNRARIVASVTALLVATSAFAVAPSASAQEVGAASPSPAVSPPASSGATATPVPVPTLTALPTSAPTGAPSAPTPTPTPTPTGARTPDPTASPDRTPSPAPSVEPSPGARAAGDLWETEPNGSSATATPLPVDTSVSGSSLSSSYMDEDWFAVDVAQAGRLAIDFRFPSGLGTAKQYDLDVFDAAGNQLYAFDLSGADFAGGSVVGQGTFVDAGRVFVRVMGYSDRASWGKTYSLSVSVKPGVVETLGNGDSSSATPLRVGRTVSGSSLSSSYMDEDWFAVDVAQAGRLAIDFRFPSGLGTGRQYDLAVIDINGRTLRTLSLSAVDADGQSLRGQPVDFPAGTSYIRVTGYSDRTSWGKIYTLTVTSPWTATPTPTITGTAKVGATLTVKPGTWGPAPVTLSYQWLRNGQKISGATKTTYRPTPSDRGQRISVRVTASKSGWIPTNRTSASVTVGAGTLSSTPTPKISGTAKVGSTLTATPGSWAPAPVSLSYQWLRNGKPISGATKATYRPTSADKGRTVTVRVTGAKSGYASVSRTSTGVTVR